MSPIHSDRHQLAGKTVTIKTGRFAGQSYRLEDWWDRLTGTPWAETTGNPACIIYGIRAGLEGLPPDNEVVYGHIGGFGHLVHISEFA